MSDQKGNQQPRRNKKKGKNNNRKGGNRNENASNNDKNGQNAGGDKQAKRKVKFPCKLCKDDHLTYLCPRIDEASRLLAQGPAVLTNPLPHNQNMNSKSQEQSSENDPPEASARGCINMVRATKVVTHAKDYGSSQPSPGKEPDPAGTPLRIEKPVDKPEAAPRIPKGVLKHLAHNPNARATKNYSVVEDLGHTPCAMSALEVLQSCPSQRKALLSALGVNSDDSSSVIKFEP